ncbi:MAG: ribosome silencing factor [Burkholderiaceae bacterium]|nr:ribosome silencing factor [Burkholderiaceae bacterium]
MDLRKLQRIVVDALDDIKAQDIRVFNTTGQTELFDRVIIATGTSNRQTRSLAAHVRDKVKEAGGTVVSMEGGETGEWVLVDLGDAVVHIMQPAIRAYYNLEELWGAKPVRMQIARAPASKAPAAKKSNARKPASRAAGASAAAAGAAGAPARKRRPRAAAG